MKYDKGELKIGIEVEREHADLVRKLGRGEITSPKQVYETIAKAHLREIPDYYSRLIHLEKEYFRGRED